MAVIFGRAFFKTLTADEAVRGFEACGPWHYNENLFTDEGFAAMHVTQEPGTSGKTVCLT